MKDELKTTQAAEDQMIALLRRIGRQGAKVAALPGQNGLVLADQYCKGDPVIPPALLQEALSRGLLECRGDILTMTGEAMSFLRRAKLEREHAFGDQHRDIVKTRVDDSLLRLNLAESPLAALARIKDRDGSRWFCRDAVLAGERLASDFHLAGLQPKMTARWEPKLQTGSRGAPGQGVEFTDSVMAARLRVGKAVTGIGPELSGVVLDVCCFMKGLEMVERERQWPARSAKVMLRAGLLALHRHYHPQSRGK